MVKKDFFIRMKQIRPEVLNNVFVSILGIVALAEFIILLTYEKDLSSFFQKFVGAYQMAYLWVGPVLWPLFLMSVVEFFVFIRLLQSRMGTYQFANPATPFKILKIIEEASPSFGFLGTCLSLIFTMSRMDIHLDQAAMFTTLLKNCASAFGSTAYGIVQALSAFFICKFFQEFLFPNNLTRGGDE